jgi:hypothetical protein
MISACGAVVALFFLAGFLANRAEDAEHVHIDNTTD